MLRSESSVLFSLFDVLEGVSTYIIMITNYTKTKPILLDRENKTKQIHYENTQEKRLPKCLKAEDN